MTIGQDELAQRIAEVTRQAVNRLYASHPSEHFYYIALVSTGEATRPIMSAWSREALAEAATTAGERELIKWSYADSPYHCWADDLFQQLESAFNSRPDMQVDDEASWMTEYEARYAAMEAALRQLDAEGVFGRGSQRETLYVNAEVMPPDSSNTERAKRLNPPEALVDWLEEAAED